MGATFLGGGRRPGEAGERLEGDGVHGVHAAAVDLHARVQRHAGALEVGQLVGAPGRLCPHGLPQAGNLATAAVQCKLVLLHCWLCKAVSAMRMQQSRQGGQRIKATARLDCRS